MIDDAEDWTWQWGQGLGDVLIGVSVVESPEVR